MIKKSTSGVFHPGEKDNILSIAKWLILSDAVASNENELGILVHKEFVVIKLRSYSRQSDMLRRDAYQTEEIESDVIPGCKLKDFLRVELPML